MKNPKAGIDIAGLVGVPSRYDLPNAAWDSILGLDVESELDPILQEWVEKPFVSVISDDLRQFLVGIGVDPNLPVTEDVLAEIDRQIVELGGNPDADE
jgi:hypothetical protein